MQALGFDVPVPRRVISRALSATDRSFGYLGGGDGIADNGAALRATRTRSVPGTALAHSVLNWARA